MISLLSLVVEALSGKDFYDQLASDTFKSQDTFSVKMDFLVDNKKVEVNIPVKLTMNNLKKEVDNYLEAPPELKAKFDTYAYWYDNFNKLVFKNMGESDACLFLAACAYTSANTALDQNILEGAKLYTAIKKDFETSEGKKAIEDIANNVKSNLKNKDLEFLKNYPNSAYANLLVPKKDYSGKKIEKGAKKGQDDIFSEITVSNAKIPNFHKYVKYYLRHNGNVSKEQLYKDIESGEFTVSGTKINSFLINLIFPGRKWAKKLDPATIDRWMIRVFFDEPLKNMVDNDITDWIEYIEKTDDEQEEVTEASEKVKLSPEEKIDTKKKKDAEKLLAKKKKELQSKKDKIVNGIVMKLFNDDIIRQNLVKILNEEAEKMGLTSYQLQALAWVHIRERYKEPAAKFAKFEDVMEYAQEAAETIMSVNPDINSVMSTIKILSSGPRFKFTNPQDVVTTIQNADKYEKIYYLPPKPKKEKSAKPAIDFTKMKIALLNDFNADVYDIRVSRKNPVHKVVGTNRRDVLKQALDWIKMYKNDTPST